MTNREFKPARVTYTNARVYTSEYSPLALFLMGFISGTTVTTAVWMAVVA